MTTFWLRALTFVLVASCASCKGTGAIGGHRKTSTRPRIQTGSNLPRQATKSESAARKKKERAAKKKKKKAAQKVDENYTPRSGFR